MKYLKILNFFKIKDYFRYYFSNLSSGKGKDFFVTISIKLVSLKKNQMPPYHTTKHIMSNYFDFVVDISTHKHIL